MVSKELGRAGKRAGRVGGQQMESSGAGTKLFKKQRGGQRGN